MYRGTCSRLWLLYWGGIYWELSLVKLLVKYGIAYSDQWALNYTYIVSLINIGINHV